MTPACVWTRWAARRGEMCIRDRPYIERELVALADYKTQLQEVVQQNPGERLRYVVVGEIGPDHDKRFEVEVHLNSNVIGRGAGRSKKLAEQQAAKAALEEQQSALAADEAAVDAAIAERCV